MITRVEIDGFKSLRGFAVDLEPLTAIVGPNAVGKSNLFDALQLLSRLADSDVTAALGAGRGSRLDQFSRAQDGAVGERIRLGVELLLSPTAGSLQQTRFRHWIELSRDRTLTGLEKIVLKGEQLVAVPQENDAWITRHADLAPFSLYDEPWVDVKMVEDTSPFSASRRTLRWTVDHRATPAQQTMGTLGLERSFLAFPPGLGPPPHVLEAVGAALRGIRFLQLEPSKLRLAGDPLATTTLASDGSNLPTALAALAPEVRAEIRADLARHVPSFKSFDVVRHEDGELRVEVELTSGQRLPARVLSDGTLRLLALFLLLRSAAPGALIAIEEPENGVHPGSLRALIEELVDATTPRGAVPPQVLLNSHSPALVAALHHRPESLVFADLIRGADGLHATRMRHVWEEGDPRDRGATTVSMSEVQRLLDTARPVDEVA